MVVSGFQENLRPDTKSGQQWRKLLKAGEEHRVVLCSFDMQPLPSLKIMVNKHYLLVFLLLHVPSC